VAKIVVSTGRDETGKTTFVTLATKYFNSPFLLVDFDPDQNLADMFGINLENEPIKKNNTEFNSISLHSQTEDHFHMYSQIAIMTDAYSK